MTHLKSDKRKAPLKGAVTRLLRGTECFMHDYEFGLPGAGHCNALLGRASETTGLHALSTQVLTFAYQDKGQQGAQQFRCRSPTCCSELADSLEGAFNTNPSFISLRGFEVCDLQHEIIG